MTKFAACLGALFLQLFSVCAWARGEVALEIRSQPIEGALKQFVEQSGVQILYIAEELPPYTAPGVSGHYLPEAGLRRLLSSSGLDVESVNSKTLSVRQGKQVAGAKPDDIVVAASSESSVPVPRAESSAPSANAGSNSRTGIPEVLVRGSRALNADIERTADDVRPYVVFDRKTLERSASADLNEFLREQLTMNYVSTPVDRSSSQGSLSANNTQVALRGLPGTETLILVDGRRTTSFKSGLAEFQSDVNSIPLAAIERIEVLPATASGIYGGNATGGVVNIILRRDYEGMETTASYKNSLESGAKARSVNIAGGTSAGGNTSIMFTASFSKDDPLLLGDRGFVTGLRHDYQEDQITRFPTSYYNRASPILGSTGNISSARVGGVVPDLVLKATGRSLGSPITHLPESYRGVSSDGGVSFVNNAGRYNTDLAQSGVAGGAGSSLIGGKEVSAVDVTLRHRFTERLSSFVEVNAGRNDASFNGAIVSGTFRIPSSSPINPFNQAIVVTAPIEMQNSASRTRLDSARAVVGFNFELTKDWSIGADYSFSTTKAQQTGTPAGFLTAATTAVTSGAVNIMQDPGEYSEALLAFLRPNDSIDPTRANLSALALRAAGPLFSTAAGPISLSLLAEGRAQHFGAYTNVNWLPDGTPLTVDVTPGKSDVTSVYAEMLVPVASESMGLGIRKLELQLAGRYDRYRLRASNLASDVPEGTNASRSEFSSVDPSLGMRFEPVRGIILRASYGTGFLPPYLSELQSLPPIQEDVSSLYFDPKRGGESLNEISYYAGGNSNLKPEKSSSWSAGLVLNPSFVPELRVSIDWVRIRKKENITSIDLSQNTIDDEDLVPGVVLREAPAPNDPFGVGRIVGFDARYRNAFRAISESYDFSLMYELGLGSLGSLRIASAATRLNHVRIQTSVASEAVESAGTRSAPKWAANASLLWARGEFGLGAAVQYLGAFWLSADHSTNAIFGTDRLSSLTYVDAFGEWDVGRKIQSQDGILSGLKMRAGVKNVLNTPPRFIATTADPWTDPRMATYFVSVTASLGRP